MVILEWLLGFGGAGLISVLLIDWVRTNRQERRLRDAFYFLIETCDGYLSLIQLAATARVDATPAKTYLETQARTFSVLPEVDAEGNTFYRFPKVRRFLPEIPEDEWN